MKHVLLTGSTGVLGLELTRLFRAKGAELHLVVRASNLEEFERKKRHVLMASAPAKPTKAAARDRHKPTVFFYRGDVTAPNFGLQDDEYQSLLNKIEIVVHCAGELKLSQAKEEALKNSLDSVKSIVEFSFKAQEAGHLEKLDIVSTVGVAGKAILELPERFLTDDDFPNQRPLFHNYYEYGKYHAEAYLRDEAAPKLPLTVHRPSMIVGLSTTGEISRFQVFYHLCELLLGRKTLGILPDLSRRTLDIIPVDTVAQGIVEAALDPTTAGRVFNLATGPEHSLLISTLANQIEDGFEAFGIQSSRRFTLPHLGDIRLKEAARGLKPLVPDSLLEAIAQKIPGGVRSLKYILEYLNTDQKFLSSEFSGFLASKGIQIPEPDSYLPQVLSYYIEKKYAGEAQASADQFVREIKNLEFFRDHMWTYVRRLVGHTLTPRCSRCALSSKASPLENSVCAECRSASSSPQASAAGGNSVVQDFEGLDRMIQAAMAKAAPNYDAIVLFSGGKDSTYMIDRLRQDYPGLRILALTIDNTFMSPVALENIKKVVKKIRVDHQTIRPSRATMRKMFAYAFRHLNERGSSGTVDQFDGDFFHDAARNFALHMEIPLIFSGLSPDQVESILHLRSFHHSLEEERQKRETVAGIPLTAIFDSDEIRRWWWDGTNVDPDKTPRTIYPFYVWRLSEERIKKSVVSKGYIDDGEQSPLLTNIRLVPLMSAVDFAQFGYSSYEPEFARNIRKGQSDPTLWRNTFEIAEFAATTGLLLDASIGDVMRELGLGRKELGLPEKANLKALLPPFLKLR